MSEGIADIKALTYEQALAELDTLIRKLEAGSIELADSIACYERGVALAAHCSGLLEQTERKVERLVMGADGKLTAQPFDEGELEAGEGSSG